MNWRVLIADDEPKVCELIKYLIPWEELGLELAATAANGLEAIEILKQQPVDIIITDARMPECDGIELIKWCHQQNRRYMYIVISGYRHFEYAHGALQYGVDYYLLKPISQTELVESLKAMIQRLIQEEASRQNGLELQVQISRNRDRLRRHFIGSYIFDGGNWCKTKMNSADIINEEYQMNFASGTYRAVIIKVDNVNHLEYKLDKLLVKINAMSETLLTDLCNEVIGTILHSGVILILNYKNTMESEFIIRIHQIYEEVNKILDIFEGLQLTIGISCKADRIQDIRHCVTTAGDAIKYRIRILNKGIISYDDYSFETVPVTQIFSAERKSLLQNFLRAGNHQGIRKLLFDCKLELRQNPGLTPVMTYELLQEAGKTAMDAFYQIIGENADHYDIFQKFDEQMDYTVREEQLWESFEALMVQCIESIDKELKMTQTKPIRLVKEYIDQHFTESITLETVAEHASLSANYVSAIFRKETGVTFYDYITAKRMDLALELLRKTDLSIAEISAQIGYVDVKYFSKLCKKTLGMKPSEYRKLYS